MTDTNGDRLGHDQDGALNDAPVATVTNLPARPLAPEDGIFVDSDIVLDPSRSNVNISQVIQVETGPERPVKRRKLSHQPDIHTQAYSSPTLYDQPMTPRPSGLYTPRRDPMSTPKLALTSTSQHPSAVSSARLDRNMYEYSLVPPTPTFLASTFDDYGHRQKIYKVPYYSKRADVPARAREYGGLRFHLHGGDGYGELEEWKSPFLAGLDPRFTPTGGPFPKSFDDIGVGGWEYAGGIPPSLRQAREWLRTNGSRRKARVQHHNQEKKLHSQVSQSIYIFTTSVQRVFLAFWIDRWTHPASSVWIEDLPSRSVASRREPS